MLYKNIHSMYALQIMFYHIDKKIYKALYIQSFPVIYFMKYCLVFPINVYWLNILKRIF